MCVLRVVVQAKAVQRRRNGSDQSRFTITQSHHPFAHFAYVTLSSLISASKDDRQSGSSAGFACVDFRMHRLGPVQSEDVLGSVRESEMLK